MDDGALVARGRRPFVRPAHRIGVLTLSFATLAVWLQPAIGRQVQQLRYDDTPLYSQTVALSPDGSVVPVTDRVSVARGGFLGGTRVLAPPPDSPVTEWDGARSLAAAQTGWLAGGLIPGRDTRWAPMVTDALADLHTLSFGNGAVVAGWAAAWRYVWPRDSAFVAAALSRTGHGEDAFALLRFVQAQQHPDGTFEARYRPEGTGPPDDRGVQLDGSGWMLWAIARWADDAHARFGTTATAARLAELRPMIDRSTRAALAAANTPSGLPPASSDYWEVPEDVTTLGTAAPLAAGLSASARIYTLLGDFAAADQAGDGARRLSASIASTFGADGFPRHVDGGGRDAAVAFLLPPFADHPDDAVVSAWNLARAELARPAGGLAPGADWKSDGVSWTPETAVFALTAAAIGDRPVATGLLDWLDRHRTSAGSLPEKVLHDGSPAGVAPLTWTSAAVILAVDALGDEPAIR